ncbi:MAG: T9SS type A sorting domain-containing protein [Bacteroidota bacterium]
MKQFLPLFVLLLLCSFQSQAQTCMPNPDVVDSSAFVLPIPYDSDEQIGGIVDTACVNNYYETALTFEVPATLSLGGFTITVDSVELDPDNPDAVMGLPEGLQYTCNRPDCKFISSVDSTGCALIFGTPTSNNTLGDFPLQITIRAYTAIGPQNIIFPNSDLPNADGEYIIHVGPENSPSCTLVSAEEVYKESFSVQANPNPFAYFTNINVDAVEEDDLELMVFNLLGRQVFQRNIHVFEGRNTFEFDATDLPAGIYLYALTDGKNVITKKMLINR